MFERSRTYYLYGLPCDMRKSFNTLALLVLEMKLDLLSGAGFVFINKRRTHLKMLLWEGDGLSMYYKRLESGTFEHLQDLENHELSYDNLVLILQGIHTKSVKKRKRFSLVT